MDFGVWSLEEGSREGRKRAGKELSVSVLVYQGVPPDPTGNYTFVLCTVYCVLNIKIMYLRNHVSYILYPINIQITRGSYCYNY